MSRVRLLPSNIPPNANAMAEQEVERILIVKNHVTTDTYSPVKTDCDEIQVNIMLGHPDSHNRPSANMYVFPDSGASIYLAGTHHIEKLDVKRNELIPCNKRISVVGGSTLPCIGWVPAEFGVDNQTTKQPLYVCDKVDRIFFSKQACIDTNIYHHHSRNQCTALMDKLRRSTTCYLRHHLH